jgi:hypothetical protein
MLSPLWQEFLDRGGKQKSPTSSRNQGSKAVVLDFSKDGDRLESTQISDSRLLGESIDSNFPVYRRVDDRSPNRLLLPWERPDVRRERWLWEPEIGWL